MSALDDLSCSFPGCDLDTLEDGRCAFHLALLDTAEVETSRMVPLAQSTNGGQHCGQSMFAKEALV